MVSASPALSPTRCADQGTGGLTPPSTFLSFICLTDSAISSLRGNHAQLTLSPMLSRFVRASQSRSQLPRHLRGAERGELRGEHGGCLPRSTPCSPGGVPGPHTAPRCEQRLFGRGRRGARGFHAGGWISQPRSPRLQGLNHFLLKPPPPDWKPCTGCAICITRRCHRGGRTATRARRHV